MPRHESASWNSKLIGRYFTMVAASPVASVARAVSGFTRSFFRPVQSLAAKGRPFGATELANGVPEGFVGKSRFVSRRNGGPSQEQQRRDRAGEEHGINSKKKVRNSKYKDNLRLAPAQRAATEIFLTKSGLSDTVSNA